MYPGPQRPLVVCSTPPNYREIPGINMTLSTDDPSIRTIRQHYYPEGDWGWVVVGVATFAHFLVAGVLTATCLLVPDIVRTFKPSGGWFAAVFLGTFSTTITLLLSPIIVAICRRKSTRLTAILGALVTALGCLFTSFATQFHQIIISYGLFVGIGTAMVRETSVIMVGQYFKKRRELVEIIILSGSGLGIAFVPFFVSHCIRSKSWRFGFQCLALLVLVAFFLGVLHRPASLYHPQRRAILHLKSLQKRSRMRDTKTTGLQQNHHAKTQVQASVSSATSTVTNTDKPAYFDFSTLKSRTVQIMLLATSVANLGLTAPLFLLASQAEREGFQYPSLVSLQVFLGLAIVTGTLAAGLVVVKNSSQCMISRQYLCQASSFVVALSLVAFTALRDYNGLLVCVWIYGFFYGVFLYSLKMFLYEKVRAHNFNRAWGLLNCSQSLTIIIGVFVTVYLNDNYGSRTGFYFSAATAALGSIIYSFISAQKRAPGS
ncbi:Monocarboxylate transporter 14 [Halotydeus destructor]|nr:Monocarboxylate transporter 14 [Halotydeus destructor]